MFRARDLNARLVLPVIDANLKMFYDNCWQEKLQAEFAVRGETHGGNKLRTYRTFKNTYSTEPYVLSLVYCVSHIVPYWVYTHTVSHPSTTMLSDYEDYTLYFCRNFVNIFLIYPYCHFLLSPHL